jgi:peptidoglycan/LPS O-acetylase OafA/YrhL
MKTDLPASKPHYEILDGLRGVAAVMVLVYHIFEAFVIDRFGLIIGHGYLAVDFFYALSGFVIGYAYDERWQRMSLGAFFKRRFIRLHPMVVFGMILGAVLFYFGDSAIFPKIHEVPVLKMLLYMALGMLLIPVPAKYDIRGWEEMYTLDAPCWSLFFEYIANILYALLFKRLSKVFLSAFVILAAGSTLYLTLTQGDVIGGWVFDGKHLYAGFTRLLYPFLAGLLLYRAVKIVKIKHAFFWSSLLLLAVLLAPRIGGRENLWMNGLYESFVILIVFPLIVFMGASGVVKGKFASGLCKFLGDISYPLYLINYPIIYIFIGWVSDTKHTVAESVWVILLVFFTTMTLSYLVTKFYDIPLRKWLTKIWK